MRFYACKLQMPGHPRRRDLALDSAVEFALIRKREPVLVFDIIGYEAERVDHSLNFRHILRFEVDVQRCAAVPTDRAGQRQIALVRADISAFDVEPAAGSDEADLPFARGPLAFLLGR